jgi:hypothetical protein
MDHARWLSWPMDRSPIATHTHTQCHRIICTAHMVICSAGPTHTYALFFSAFSLIIIFLCTENFSVYSRESSSDPALQLNTLHHTRRRRKLICTSLLLPGARGGTSGRMIGLLLSSAAVTTRPPFFFRDCLICSRSASGSRQRAHVQQS